jgi:hypothetical protein
MWRGLERMEAWERMPTLYRVATDLYMDQVGQSDAMRIEELRREGAFEPEGLRRAFHARYGPPTASELFLDRYTLPHRPVDMPKRSSIEDRIAKGEAWATGEPAGAKRWLAFVAQINEHGQLLDYVQRKARFKSYLHSFYRTASRYK